MCSICLSDDPPFVKTACGHEFHKLCLDTWHSKSDSCPNCRTCIDEFSDGKILFIQIKDQSLFVGLSSHPERLVIRGLAEFDSCHKILYKSESCRYQHDNLCIGCTLYSFCDPGNWVYVDDASAILTVIGKIGDRFVKKCSYDRIWTSFCTVIG